MKTAKKILSVFMAVLMLFSVMSVGMGSIMSVARDASVGSLTGNDTIGTTDDVIICVPETIYMRPGNDASVSAQYYVNNYVNESGNIIVESANASGGKISIYAPGATAFYFTANPIPGSGIGDAIFGSTVNASTQTYEGQRWNNTDLGYGTGFVYFDALQLYINGTGLAHGKTALIEWKVTVFFGNDDTTGRTYYAYTTLYSPHRSVGAVSESKRTDKNTNEVSAWITGITGVGGRQSQLGGDRVPDGGSTGDGYFTYDPLWTSTFGGGSFASPYDFVTAGPASVHSVATADDPQWSRSIGYTGYVTIDSSRYSNTNQIPNFRIGVDILRVGGNPKDSTDFTAAWYTLGTGDEAIGSEENSEPSGWTKAFDTDRYGSTGRIVSVVPSYNVADINGKYIHVAAQVGCTYMSDRNYANSYVSAIIFTADKSDLRAAIIQATSLDETKYTQNSWSGASATVVEEFLEALRMAAEVLGNPSASQMDVDSALNQLNAKKNALKVEITFNASHNGGVFTDGESEKIYNVRFGSANAVTISAALLNYFQLAKAGYELAGWTLDPDAPANTASLEAVQNVTFGDTLYAHFKKDIAVDFHYLTDLSGGTTVYTETLTIYNNEDKALDVKVPDAENVGQYIFAGWTEDPMSTNGEKFEGTLDGVTESSVYYATYDQILRLTLDANGGNCADAYLESGIGYNYDLTQTEGTAVVTLPEVTKTGYSFLGWNIDGTRYQAGDTIELTQNTTATAEWAVDVYEVVFNYKTADGSNATVKVNVEYGQAATAPEVSDYYYDANYHYAFKGWDTSFDSVSGNTVVNAVYDTATLGNRHTYKSSGAPSCEENVDVVFTCTVCKYSYTKTFEAGHEYVLTDSKEADCTNDGYKTYVCNRDSSHTYTDVIKAKGHSPSDDAVFTPATCTTPGYYESGTCTVCSESLTGVIAPLGHDYVVTDSEDPTCTEDGYKVYVCNHDASHTYTETVPATGHSYKSVTTPASCGKEGSVVYTCTVCGHSYTVKLDALEHHYSKMVIAPTCTSKGYTATICTLCGISSRENYVDALGHDEKTTAVAPTCTEQGYIKHTCTVCNYSYKTDYVNAIGHDYSIETEVAPTCTDRGYILHTCANCGDSYKSDYVPATGHDYVLAGSVQATATMAGYHLYKCTQCDSTYKEMQYTGGKALLCVTLYDTEGGQVTGATIVLTSKETGKQTVITTDANGYFTHVMPEGEYSISITRSGYFCNETGSLTVELGSADLKLPKVEKNPCTCLCHQNTFWAQIYRFFIKMFSIFGQIYCCECCEIWD